MSTHLQLLHLHHQLACYHGWRKSQMALYVNEMQQVINEKQERENQSSPKIGFIINYQISDVQYYETIHMNNIKWNFIHI